MIEEHSMIRLSFVGDIACDRPLLKAAKKENQYNFSDVFQTKEVFSDSDLVIGNLESCFGGGPKYGYKPYHYSVPDSFCTAIRDAGFDIVSTANNHCIDEGVSGLHRTLDVVHDHGIEATGTFYGNEQQRYLLKEVNGIKLALYSLTYSVNTCCEASDCDDLSRYINLVGYRQRKYSKNPVVSYYQTMLRPNLRKVVNKIKGKSIILPFVDSLKTAKINENWLDKIDRQICEARENADVLIILLHIGGQFNEQPGDYVEYMVDHLCDLGADIIVGHHPHTVQKIVQRENKVIAYSLGGYCLSPSGEYLVHSCLPEYSAALHIDIESDGTIGNMQVDILKCVENSDHYVHVIPVKEDDENLSIIRARLGLVK